MKTGWRKGEAHPKARLSNEDVQLIRQCYESGGFTYRSLARKFDAGECTIRDIVKYRTRT